MYVARKLTGSPCFKDGRGARGVNGWFKPVGVELFTSDQNESMTLEFGSSRGFPISVNLSNAEMLAVGELIVETCRSKG